MKLAVIGSRGFNDYAAMEKVLVPFFTSGRATLVISGGARGADEMAVRLAGKHGVPTLVFLPDWNAHGKAAGFMRNCQIVDEADEVIAFWDGESRGTEHTMDLTRKAMKPLAVIRYENKS